MKMYDLDLGIELSEVSSADQDHATENGTVATIMTTDLSTRCSQIAKIISLLRPLQESARNGLDRMMLSNTV